MFGMESCDEWNHTIFISRSIMNADKNTVKKEIHMNRRREIRDINSKTHKGENKSKTPYSISNQS